MLVAQQVIPLTGHSYRTSVKAAACTEGGYTAHTCADCGDRYLTGRTAPRGHWFGAWTSNGSDAHSAACRRDACGHTGTTACEWFDWRLFMPDEEHAPEYAFAFCPVCGEVSDGTRLLLVEMAKVEALTEKLPAGEAVLRMGKLANGETVLTVCFEYAGRIIQPEGELEVTLPADLLNGCALALLGADGAESALAVQLDEAAGEASFALDFSPLEGEEPLPARVLRLAPAAA